MQKSAVLCLFAVAAFGQTCQIVDVDGSNAGEIAAKLNKITDRTTVLAPSADKLLVCSEAATITAIQSTIPLMAHAVHSDSHSVRLFFNRDATSFASALNNAYGFPVSAVGKDLLVFGTDKPEDEEHIRELKRWIALLDTPRPEVTIDAWSVQVSSKSPEELSRIAAAVRGIVFDSDQTLRDSLQRGWDYLNARRFDRSYPSPWFRDYVLNRFVYARNKVRSPQADPGTCGPEGYCLGYLDSFSLRMQPSLSNMIGILAAARSKGPRDLGELVDRFVDKLEEDGSNPPPETKPSEITGAAGCEKADEAIYMMAGRTAPAFNCFRRQLAKSFQANQLMLLRTAIADSLFQYKFAIEYPHDFSSYDYTASAQQLNTQLDPLLVAFNHDVVYFLRHVQQSILNAHDKTIDFASNGIVTVKTISGSDGSVNTGTQSAFAATPAPLAQDFLKNLAGQPSTLTGVLSSNLPPNAAQALAAFLNSSQRVTAMVGRNLNLDVTPVTLPGASSAELAVTLESKDDGTPSIVTNGTAQNDTTDRITNHKVTTTVRVDSLKLFEISTLSSKMSRGRDPIPLLPPFVQLPYIGSFASYKPKPSLAYHQSFAIVSATILPSAADLINGLRFRDDHTLTADQTEGAVNALPVKERQRLTEQIQKFHRTVIGCIVWESLNTGGTAPEGCEKVSDTVAP
jgi:hypothetical protein